MKKRVIRPLIIISVITLFVIGYICLFPINSNAINRMILSPFEKMLQKKIEFTASNIWLPGRISLEEASVSDKSGRLYYCRTASFKYNIARALLGKKELTFNLKAVKLYKDIDLLNSVSTMLEISKMPDIEFEGIEGAVKFYKDGVHIKRLYAYNDTMRIRGEGWVSYTGVLNCDIRLAFNETVIDIVPEVVKTAILKSDSGGWIEIDLKATGNYKKPSLHIATDLATDTIILNIKEGFLRHE